MALILSIEPVADAASAALQPAHLRCRRTPEPGRPPDLELRSDMRYADTNDLINSMQGLSVDGVALPELLRLDDASMWQFLPSYVWPDVFRAVELTKVILEAVDRLAPEALVTRPTGDRYEALWHAVGAAVAAKAGIDHSAENARTPKHRRRPLVLRPRGLAQAARETGARLRSARSSGWEAKPANRTLAFATLLRHWVDDPERPGQRHDEQLSPLLHSLRSAGWNSVVAIDCPYNSAPDFSSLRERQRDTPDWVTWRSFNAHGGMSAAERRGASGASRAWQHAVGRAARDAGPQLSFRGVELGRALAETLAGRVRSTVAECAEMRAQARRMLREERPHAVMASYETGPYARALLIEAARIGLPTVGLQHGMILDNHYDYMHAGVGPDPTRDPFTIPTRTCVWGPFWKRILTEAGHYPDAAVRVTGNWRHARESEAGDPATAGRRALALADEDDLVLVCTAAQGTDELVRSLGPLRASIGPAELRIRPHPSEDLEAVAAAYAVAGGDPAHVSRDGELAEVLAAATLVVSQLSTVISEAVLADRPVIIADFDRQEGWDAYKSSAATLVAADGETLAVAARSVSDATVADGLRAGRAQLIDEFFNGRDGRAAERVVAALEA